MMLEQGQSVPPVTLKDMNGVNFALDSFSGDRMVVYLYEMEYR